MHRSAILATMSVLALAGCGNESTDEAPADQVAASEQAAAEQEPSSPEPPPPPRSAWTKQETKDAFTDQVTYRSFSSGPLSIDCGNGGIIEVELALGKLDDDFYGADRDTKIRIDDGSTVTEKWSTWGFPTPETRMSNRAEFNGYASPIDQTSLQQRLNGASKIVIQIDNLTAPLTIDVTGADKVMADMRDFCR